MSQTNYIDVMEECHIPPHMRHGLHLYLTEHIPPGGFLTAVLSNDLMNAYAHADNINAAHMRSYVVFLFNHAPRSCYGSPEAVTAWLNQKEN